MSDIIDRESLLIYLNDLRTMETIVYESEKKINELKQKEDHFIHQNCSSSVNSSPDKPTEPVMPDKPDKNKWKKFLIIGAVCIPGVFLGGFIGGLCIFIGIALIIAAFVIRSIENNDYIEELMFYDCQMDNYKKDLQKYEQKKIEYNRQCNETKAKINDYADKTSKCLNKISLEKYEISQKLKKAYDVNIIPMQFRNIRGVYYLYDYLSTSNQSLSEALMQCNLEAIKEKLDNVIQLQSKAIIQQAKANAALYEQNQKILETAQATMNNTAVAAKYAQISAINSELSLKLQNKQLAYQSADFWLK